MKIRNGFVTNSSSSSFIVAIKGGLDNIDKFIDVDNKIWKEFIVKSIKQMFEYEDHNDTHEAKKLFSNERELNMYIKEEYICFNIDEMEKYKKLIKDGYTIYEKPISYHNDILNDQMNAMCDGKNIILIEKGG
jgi:hypothetical protein